MQKSLLSDELLPIPGPAFPVVTARYNRTIFPAVYILPIFTLGTVSSSVSISQLLLAKKTCDSLSFLSL
jgi:hypothetical protein